MANSFIASLLNQIDVQRIQWIRIYRDWRNSSTYTFVFKKKLVRTGCRYLLCQMKSPIPKTSAKIRIHNLKKSTISFEGTLIEPGQVFSFFHLLGKPQQEYKKGPHFDQNQVVHSYEAGLGQLASIFHYLALLTHLEVMEHHPALRPLKPYQLDYIPLGLEACVTWGLRDLRFKNTLPFDISFQFKVSNEEIIITLYGKENKKFPYVLKTETLENQPPNKIGVRVIRQNTETEEQQTLFERQYQTS